MKENDKDGLMLRTLLHQLQGDQNWVLTINICLALKPFLPELDHFEDLSTASFVFLRFQKLKQSWLLQSINKIKGTTTPIKLQPQSNWNMHFSRQGMINRMKSPLIFLFFFLFVILFAISTLPLQQDGGNYIF
jgi:glucuronate isomerase